METEPGNGIRNYRKKSGLSEQCAAKATGLEKEGETVSSPDMKRSELFDLKSVLLTSLQGYLEANLSKNEILGDVIIKTEGDVPVLPNLYAEDGTRLTYDEFVREWAGNTLVSSQKQFLEKSNCNWLISCCRTGKRVVDIFCTVKDSEGNPRELKQTYYLSESSDGDVYAISVISFMPETNSSITTGKQYAEIAAELSESFEGIFYVDIRDDSYVAVKTRGAFYNISHNISGKDFFKNSLRHLRGVVHQEDFHFVADFLQKDFLQRQLKNGRVSSMIFRLQLQGKDIFYRARVSKSAYDDYHILFALENVSEFVNNEKIQNEKLLRDKNIIEVLASEYTSIYYVNLEENSFEIYKLDSVSVPDQQNVNNALLSFSEAYAKCVEEMVCEADREEMLRAGSIYNILSVLRERESFTVTYRTKRQSETAFCEMKVARVGNEPLPKHIVIGFADNSIEKARELEKAKNISIVLQLADSFEAVYDIDLRTGHFVSYSDSDIFSGERFFNVILDNDIFKGFEMATDRVVFIDDRPLVKTFLTREYLRKALTENQDFQMDFRFLIGGIPTWYHLKAVMKESSNGQGIILGLFNIEDQRQKEYYHMTEVKKLTQEAHYDLLTGIRNRNAYTLFLKEMDKTMQDSRESFAVAIFDINDLKHANDQYGHEEGDRLIKKTSALICDTFQHSPVFRIGGDEFAAILRGKDFENRNVLIDSVRRTSEENIGTGDPVTACGFADRQEEDRCFDDIFNRADKEMYRNKLYLKSL